nr:RHS repeat domain-containing protein [uncultured Allomuricauda sp.]
MKIILKTLFFLIFAIGTAMAQESDITTPETSPFSTGIGIEGLVQNSVSEVTGKVAFSVPVANIVARSVSYPVSLAYNGAAAFDQAQQVHKYSPVSPVGVGFSLNVPKILVDHKGTAARDDDTFYLMDGTGNTKLFCTNKNIIDAPATGDSYMEFEMEKYAPYKIRYKVSTADFVNSIYTVTPQDYWQITDDKGIIYTYGGTSNAREHVIAWDNWIGDSEYLWDTSYHTVVWNLSKVQDQWGNNLTFSYDQVEEQINASPLVHTEASYIEEITSSTGGKITFQYGDKLASDYYEPHQERSEPDPYQERYEKKYLQNVKTYDISDQLISTLELSHSYVNTALGERKMYLDKLTLKDKDGNAQPSQDFDYYTTGTFEGGIEKITYPAGGSVTYNYENKLLFSNTSNRFTGTNPSTSGYYFHGSYVQDKYVINLFKSSSPISGNKYRFKMIRHWWDGENWLSDEFIFPHLLSDEQGARMDEFLSVFEDDFYGFLYFDRSIDRGYLYLFHLEDSGLTWKYNAYNYFSLQSNNNDNQDFPYKDPRLLSGDGFVAVGENESTNGRLHTYVWNGSSWNTQTINQGIGTYYYAAANNFIISLDENGNGTDLITGATHGDYYYIHYLDNEKIWQTKSWSSKIDYDFTYVAATNDPSYFYPYNNMVGFMADNNNEFVLRWDTNYNLIAVDDFFGAHPDSYPMYPSMGSMITLQNSWYNSFPETSARFDGDSWTTIDLNPDNYNSYGSTAFGQDFVLMYNRVKNDFYKTSYSYFDPDTNQWNSGTFSHITPWSSHYHLAVSYNQDFFVAGNRIGKFNNQLSKFDALISLSGDNHMTYSNTLNYSFVGINNSGSYSKGLLYRVDKNTGNIVNIDLGYKTYAAGVIKFGGYNHFLTTKSMFLRSYGGSSFSTYLYRIIDDEVGNNVYDIVVSDMQVDNGDNEVRTIDYVYNSPNSIPEGESTFYGEVIVQNKGFGSGNIGRTIKYFNTGEDDVQMAGLPTKVVAEDKNGNPVSETETVWKKFTKNYINSAYKTVGVGHYVRPEQTIEKIIFNSDEVVTETTNSYNTIGMLASSSRVNSNGDTEVTSTQYAYLTYSFLNDRNMLSFPYQTTTLIGGTTAAVEQSIWKLDGGRAYAYQNKSGTNTSTLRINNEITKVDAYGNVQESNNGQGIYKTKLYGYDNLYPVATITNAEYNDVVAELNVSYSQLQNLTSTLESELDDLYNGLPGAMLNINIYDDQGRVVRTLDERGEAVNFVYDSFGRLEYTTDADDKVIQKKEYNFASN